MYMQVIGKLPFDDANHKKLLKLILAGPVFPPDREASPTFEELVVSILKREETRLGIPEIRQSTWYGLNATGQDRATRRMSEKGERRSQDQS